MTSMSTTITFLGAAETVTGSRYLIETDQARILVDCGLFQGFKKLRERNWSKLPFDPASLDAVVLTHAHLDHSGYIPKLCKLGFTGSVICTEGTRDLLGILLPDAGHLQEDDARRANKYGYTRHHPAQPLYTRADAEACLKQLVPKPYNTMVPIARGITATFTHAGHIIGAACVTLRLNDMTVAFTGDVGRPNDPIMKPAEPLDAADYLITESTYGDRCHPPEDVREALAQIILSTAANGGVVLVPSFAVGRTQHLLHIIAQLKAAQRIPDIPVVMDSPMAINATELFYKHHNEHTLTPEQCQRMSDVAQYARTVDESKAIDQQSGPMIVISASGMATGGRILHHLGHFLRDINNTILFVGYQAGGTRGRMLLEGTDEIKLHGQYIPVRARIAHIEALSAHADHREMLNWFASSHLTPKRVFVTHGELPAADAFRRRLKDTFGWNTCVPEDGSRWQLT